MSKWIVRLLLVLLCGSSANAAAQIAVGYCDDHVMKRRHVLVESSYFTPGYSFKTAGLQVFQNGPYAAPTLVPAAPDPSGIHLLAVRSGIPGLQFWIARDGRFITIRQDGLVTYIGDCAFTAAFASQFPRPAPTPPVNFTDYAMGFDGSVLASDVSIPTPSPIAAGNIPAYLFGEGVHISSPLLVKEKALPGCLAGAGGDQQRFYDCVLGQSLGSKERKIYECSRTSANRNELTICLLAANMGNQEAADFEHVRRCYATLGENWSSYPLCLADGRVDPKVMNLVDCARREFQPGKEPSYWSLGACALGPEAWQALNPNTESTIALECAAYSGGNPKAFAVCTGGRLIANELDKCLTQGIGDKGCFGKNNTVSQVYQKIDDELAKALGKSNPAYTAWRAARLAGDPAMMARAAEDVNREIGRSLSNISKEAEKALDGFGEAAASVIPRVKVGKPKGKIFGKKWSL